MTEDAFCPRGICVSCTDAGINAYEFRILTKNSNKVWSNCVNGLNKAIDSGKPPNSLYTVMREDLSVLSVNNNFNGDSKSLLNHLINRVSKKKHMEVEKKPRAARSGPPCKCTDCGKLFNSPYYLTLHLKNSGQKEACALCGTMVFRGLEMKEHLQAAHGKEVHMCTDCPMLFTHDYELKQHTKRAHRAGALTCFDCGRTFPRNASFEVHAQMHAVRTCRACGAQFTNRACYREHRSNCEPGAKPDTKNVPRSRRSNIRDPATFICDYCGKTYLSRPQLKNHIVWIHMDIRPHQCQWCGKRFYTPTRLAEHSVVHTRERNFECDICGAKLVSKMAAVYHRRRHTGEKPYECQSCGEKFISSSRRSEHAKRRHGLGSKLQCMDCPATFVRIHELKKHIAKVHGTQNSDLSITARS
ncbi:Zinc finger protein 571 [Papilio machaon]|uniref:Zinc finger protein 571 n=1 Tax=Papilio machaon TaxID=76193 RepID=A0A0N1IBY4_PAPMA|nr:Zinc finger protein 571 [Papilio machaon]